MVLFRHAFSDVIPLIPFHGIYGNTILAGFAIVVGEKIDILE